MRDAIAALVALVLLIAALSLATTLQRHQRRRQRQRESERALGRRIIVEIPGKDDFILVSEDDSRFYYGEQSIDNDLIVAVRVLINGAPIAAYVSRRHAADEKQPTTFDDHQEGIARDRWDVAVETMTGTTLIECGAIRERVSQELARTIFEAIKSELERRDAR